MNPGEQDMSPSRNTSTRPLAARAAALRAARAPMAKAQHVRTHALGNPGGTIAEPIVRHEHLVDGMRLGPKRGERPAMCSSSL